MTVRIGPLLLTLAMATALSACGGGSSSGGDSTTGLGDSGGDVGDDAGSLSTVVGLWDWTETKDGLEDVFYFEFFPDGRTIGWDFLGDEYDQLGNCYFKTEDTIEALGGNLYDVGGFDSTISIVNNVLTITDLGINDTSTMTRVTNFTSAEFNQC